MDFTDLYFTQFSDTVKVRWYI